MSDYLTPGVYIEEVNSGNQPIEGVSTSTVGFLGVAERGPLTPTLITSFTDFTRAFGLYYKTDRQFYLAYAVEGFFQNGGQQCFVQAVRSSTAVPAAQTVDGKMAITAVSGGTWGDNVGVKVEKSGNGTGIKVTIMYWSQKPPVGADGKTVKVDPTSRAAADLRSVDRRIPQVSEVYDDLDANPLSTSFYAATISSLSNLVDVTQAAAGLPALQPLTLLAGGTDGAALNLGDFQGNLTALPGQKNGLDAFTAIDQIALLCCPDSYALGNNDDINNLLIDQCEVLMNRFAILNSIANAPAPGTLSISYNSEYSAYYYPWINIIDPTTDQTVMIPPSGHVAGIYARTDNTRNVAKAPANAQILGIDSLQFVLTDAQQAFLNPIGINALRFFTGSGNLVWGARTTSIDPSWRYINVRRLFIFIEQSILQSTQWAVFEVNDEPVWAQIRRAVSDFLTTLWMDDMLQGATKEQAFFVRCDRTTMTQDDIDNGRLICLIGVAPVYPAEFVIFRIGQWAGGSSISE